MELVAEFIVPIKHTHKLGSDKGKEISYELIVGNITIVNEHSRGF